MEARLRRTGGGRTCLPESDPGVLKALDALVEPHDQRRGHASGSQCAVRAHQHDGHAASATRSAGIAVDTKKKELVGPFKNGGREWQPKGEPEEVDRHDFPDLQLGKVISSGVVDLSQNEGWVSVGIDHETAQFAGQAIGRWWKKMGAKRYPDAQERLITADEAGQHRLPVLPRRRRRSAARAHRGRAWSIGSAPARNSQRKSMSVLSAYWIGSI